MRTKLGFTYIELTIYLGVFIVISSIFASVLISFTRLSSQQFAESELNNQTNFVLQKIQNLITSPETSEVIVNSRGVAFKDKDNNPSVGNNLRLRRKNSVEDPMEIYISSSAIVIDKQVGKPGKTTENITSSKVNATNLTFTKNSNSPSHDLVSINLTLTYNLLPPNNIARTILSTVGRASAATFDDNILPVANPCSNCDVGSLTNKWKNGFFSGKIKTDAGLQITTPATPKASCASASDRGLFWVTPGVSDPGATKDKVEVCAKDALDSYSWRTIY